MRLNYNQFLAVVYADVFGWPLTKKELRVWSIDDKRRGEVKEVENIDKLYFLPGRGRLVKLRKQREAFLPGKLKKAVRVADRLAKISTVEGIFLTGSVAVGNAKEEADVDLMIVCKPGTLWLTRFWIFALLKSLKLLRSLGDHKNKICPNIFLDTDHLEIKEKNLYTAHEILQAKCLFNRGGIERKWLEKNKWVEGYLPNAYKSQITNHKFQVNRKQVFFKNWNLCGSWYLIFEIFAFAGQHLFMRPKMTNERVGWGYAFFHPRGLGETVEKKFRQRLIKYSL